MKTTKIFACLALAASALTGCVKENLEIQESAEECSQLVLTVTQEGADADTRLALGQNGLTTEWEPGDRLVLVNKARTKAPIYLTCSLESNSPTATFVSDGGVPADDYWVIYNYNEHLAYTHQPLSSIDDINEKDKLVLYGELTVTSSTSNATVTMKHLYAKLNLKLQNFPTNSIEKDFHMGMYSSKKGMPIHSMFTPDGIVNAEYGIDPSSLYGSMGYFKSDRKCHNIDFGYYYIEYSWSYDEQTGTSTNIPTNLDQLQTYSVLVLPQDLSDEDVFFYVCGNGNNAETGEWGPICYEFKKEIGKVNLQAGKGYTIVLDFNQATKSFISRSSNYEYEIKTNADWRHAAYTSYTADTWAIANDLDFANDYFFPIVTSNINGNDKTIKNISLEWDEDNVGLYRVSERSDYGSNNPRDAYCKISNLTLENVTFKGKNYVGAFGGYNVLAENCSVTGKSTISGTGNYVGGIVGWNYINSMSAKYPISKSSIGQDCIVTGNNYVGGIAGAVSPTNSESTIHINATFKAFDNCISSASVSGSGDYVGGIFGKLGGSLTNTYSNVYFGMEDYTLSILKCQNKGVVTGRHYVGGIGGAFAIAYDPYSADVGGSGSSNKERVVISNSCSEGTVTGENYVGGIFGQTYGAINTCYSINKITGTNYVGGITGAVEMGMFSRIANCYSLSDLSVDASSYAGGIVGYAFGGPAVGGSTIEHSYFAGTNPQGSGIIGYSGGLCTVNKCLTVLASLGTNLGEHTYQDEYGYNSPMDLDDVITDSSAEVTSILANINVINTENAYSSALWENFPYECVKFASFSTDVDSPGFGDGGEI